MRTTARPDLVERRGGLTAEEMRLLEEHGYPVPSPGTALPPSQTGRGPSPSGAADEERDAP